MEEQGMSLPNKAGEQAPALQPLAALYSQTFGAEPTRIVRLKGAGSNRRYYRLYAPDGSTSIGVRGTSARENRAFFGMASLFARQELPVPAVYALSADESCYLQEDLGDRSLFDSLRAGREAGGHYSEEEEALLHRVISLLPAMQVKGDQKEVYSLSFPMPAMDERSVRFDLNYFKYCFLKLSGVEFDELALEDDFDRLTHCLLRIEPKGFQYRDFQARNVMLSADGQPRFIDFQGGRRGPLHYDVASFLYQASAAYSPDLRERLLTTYLSALASLKSVDEPQFRRDLRLMVLFRCLQVLGAYGYRGLWEGKPHFVESIVPALANLCEAVEADDCGQIPQLRAVATQLHDRFCPPADSHTAQLLAQDQQRYQASAAKPHVPLVVDVWSFSYKKGIPADPSGNGGGYVFDCRSTHNPGRFAEFRELTGLDAPVRRFLEEDGELLQFLRHVDALADFHVRRYLQRGFSHLQFAFGCTGGQHRSVYSAQHLAERIHREFGVEVHLHHREQHIDTILQ